MTTQTADTFTSPFGRGRLLAFLLVLAMTAVGCSAADTSTEAVDAAVDSSGDSSGDRAAAAAGDSSDTATSSESAAPEAAFEGAEEAMEDDSASDAVSGDSASGDSEADFSESASELTDDSVEPEFVPAEEPEFVPQAGLLTAGDIDDNLNNDYFTNLVAGWLQEQGSTAPSIELRDRVVVNVRGDNGVGIGNVPILVSDGETTRTVVTTSAGDGYVYPTWLGLRGELTLEVEGQEFSVDPATNDDAIEVTVADGDTTPPRNLDIALTLDATGSMSDELRFLTVEFDSIVNRLSADYSNVDMRFALIVYRDIGDDYVTRAFDFTDDPSEMTEWLQRQQANGGGDFPEAMDAALIDAADLSWREGTDVARALVLNADAPPHQENIAATLEASEVLGEQGVRIYSLAASGVDRSAEFLMRTMAATTGGRHLFLTSDSGVGGSKLEPIAQCYVVTGLDDLLYRVMATELAGERIEADPSRIVRTVGSYDRGFCAA